MTEGGRLAPPPARGPRITGRLLARNALLNLGGQVLPLVLAVAAIPAIIDGLGAERFGVLSLVWTVLGSAASFDLGFGRATTRCVAEALGAGREREIPPLVWTSATVQAAVGAVGALLLVATAPFLVERVLTLSPDLAAETKLAFVVTALALPVVLLSFSFAGVLEAAQRFDLLNAVRVPSNAAMFLLPLVGVRAGLGLPGILGCLLLARVVALPVLFLLTVKVFPEATRPHLFRCAVAGRLWAFGGWVAASNALAPLLRYLDRYLIASLISVSAAAYYTVPFDLIERAWVIPSSLVAALFPAFSLLSGSRDDPRARDLFLRSVKYLVVLAGPVGLVVAVYAETILTMWVGHEFAQHGAQVFRILGLAAFVGVLAPVAGATIEGYGRPDVIAKLYLVYLPLNVVLTWTLVRAAGLQGAAAAFAVRTVLDTGIVFGVATRLIGLPFGRVIESAARPAAVLGLSAAVLWLADRVPGAALGGPITPVVVLAVAAVATWRWALSADDRLVLRSLVGGGAL